METVAAALPDVLSDVVRDTNETATENRWSIGTRIAFRFVCFANRRHSRLQNYSYATVG